MHTTIAVRRSAAESVGKPGHGQSIGWAVGLLTALLISIEPAQAASKACPSGKDRLTAASAAERSWQAAERVYPSGHARDAAMAGGTAVVAFTTGDSVRAAYRTPSGSWDVKRLGRGLRPRVAVSDDGSAVVAWMLRAGRERQVVTSVRTSGDAPWESGEVVTRRGIAPVVAIGNDGRVRLLALRWRSDPRRSTAVMSYTRDADWSTGARLSQRRLHLRPQLRNSLRVTTTPRGRLVAAWQCGRSACMVFPGSLGEEPQTVAPKGKLAVSVSPDGNLWLATRFELSELEPGIVFSQSFGIRGEVKGIGLDVESAGGAVSWLVRANGPLWVGQQTKQGNWSNVFRLVRHAHGVGEATFVDPGTVVAVWRNARGRLRLSSHVKGEPWRSEGAMGRDVGSARLVSNEDNEALVTWSADGARPGVFVAVRLID